VVGRASRKQGALIGKVPVYSEPLHTRPLGYSADGGLGGAHSLMQLDGRLCDPPPGLLLTFGAPLHLVLTCHISRISPIFIKQSCLLILTDTSNCPIVVSIQQCLVFGKEEM
jgi:hypothetical protein